MIRDALKLLELELSYRSAEVNSLEHMVSLQEAENDELQQTLEIEKETIDLSNRIGDALGRATQATFSEKQLQAVAELLSEDDENESAAARYDRFSRIARILGI
jgi:hypothetical protein